MVATIAATSHFYLEELEVPADLCRKLRRADDYIKLAVVAASRVLHENYKDAEKDELDTMSCGLVLGSAFSTMQTNFEVLDNVVSGEQTSPTLFSHSVFNAAAGYIASTLGLKGGALTITDFSFPFFKALEQAYFALSCGRLENCLVLQVETYSHLLADGRKKLITDSTPWKPGVVCLLLEKGQKDSSPLLHIENIEITSRSYASESRLVGRQDLMIGEDSYTTCEPLEAAVQLTQLLSDKTFAGGDFSVHSDWGDVRLQLGVQLA